MSTEILFELTIASHYFKVSQLSIRMEKVANDFAYRFVKYGIVRQPQGRFIRQMVAVFAASNAARTEYRFHINALEEFKRYIQERYITSNLYKTTVLDFVEAKPLELVMDPKWKLYDYQEPVVEYLLKPGKPHARFVGIQTGKGKTLSASFGMVSFGKVTVVIIKPMYIEKWIGDFEKLTNANSKARGKPTDIMAVRGSAALMSMLQLAKDDELKAKIIIISNVTMQGWIKEYEKVGARAMLEQGYACTPEELFPTLKAGLRLVDEVHQDLHLNMKIDLYTHVERSFSLSATLLNNDSFIQKMQELMYPSQERYQGGALHKYIASIAYLYHLKPERKYQTQEFGSSTYSHIAYERSIMRNQDFMESYFSMIKTIVNQAYVQKRKPGQKFAVFVASIAMATALTEYLSDAFKDVDVQRYVEDDPYDNLIKADLRVTTIISGGTAHDIPNLIGLLLTTSIDSIQANIQVLGRLREIVGDEVWFLYLACMDIPKQMLFHERKTAMLNERAKSLKNVLAKESV